MDDFHLQADLRHFAFKDIAKDCGKPNIEVSFEGETKNR
jgi:hypothetical protein